uniref:RNase H type-1 domain-containing protein n=1 Tax=Solanum tuberosum TaxID=4113 RepID=M1E0P0_SOLTU
MGCVIRNHLGDWIIRMSSRITSNSVQNAELLALLHGLRLAISKNFKVTNPEAESTKKLVGSSEPMNPHLAPPLTTIATDSKEGVDPAIEGSTILHEFREGNSVADLLARKGRDLQNALRFEIWNEAPIFVLDDVKEDKKNSTLVNQGPNLCNMLPIMSTIEHVISSDARSNADTFVVMMLTYQKKKKMRGWIWGT